jgi:hypothetical protein
LLFFLFVFFLSSFFVLLLIEYWFRSLYISTPPAIVCLFSLSLSLLPLL